jgi:periplasmic mercuric ion binding protein
MKSFFATTLVALALAGSAYADASVKLTDVHLCCQSCVKGVQKAVAKVPGVKAESDMDDKTISLTAPDAATLQKGVDSLTAAGYYGKSSDAAIKVNAETGAKDVKVEKLKIEDTHLCCGSCVKAVNKALADIPGVTGNTATKGATSFEVTGDFNEKAVFDALQKKGLTGHVAQ